MVDRALLRGQSRLLVDDGDGRKRVDCHVSRLLFLLRKVCRGRALRAVRLAQRVLVLHVAAPLLCLSGLLSLRFVQVRRLARQLISLLHVDNVLLALCLLESLHGLQMLGAGSACELLLWMKMALRLYMMLVILLVEIPFHI